MSEIQIFFLAVGIVPLILLAVPIAFVPLRWARALRWPVPEGESANIAERNLTLYFGRCLGVMAIAFCVAAIAFAVANNIPEVFVIQTILTGIGLTAVHLYGAIKKIQPFTETVEMFIYAGLTVWAVSILLRFY